MEQYSFFVGIDWGSQSHQLCVLDAQRQVLDERAVSHRGPGHEELVERLMRRAEGKPERVAVAIEVPRGSIVETLVERGFHVYSINPKQVDRFRDRHTVAGAKDDRRDAFVLADSLRTDLACFRRVRLDDPVTIRLRELSRLEDDLAAEERRLANQLRDLLLRTRPALLALSPAADDAWLWRLLDVALTAEEGMTLGRTRVENILRTFRIRRVSARDVVAALREPPVYVAPGTVEAVGEHIRFLLPRLRLARENKTECGKRLEALLDQLASSEASPSADDTAEDAEDNKREHRDVAVIRSLPGVGRIVTGTMLAEASQPLGERDYQTLRTQGGLAPVTKQSGKRKVVVMRYACNQRLRGAFYHWARSAIQRDPAARAHYDVQRTHHSHGQALRAVADRLLRILISMLKHNTLYDPERAQHRSTDA